MYPRLLIPALVCHFVLAAGAAAQDDADAGFADNLSAYQARQAAASMLLDGVRAGGQLIVVGEHGHILVSGDDGQTWAQTSTPTRSALTGVDFADANTGFAVGHDAVILRTVDAGASWERVYFDPELQTPLLDVWAASAQRAIAVGAYGLYLETNDGGKTWTRRPFFSEPLPQPEVWEGSEEDGDDDADSEDDYEDEFVDPDFGEEVHLNQITAAADGTLYIAGERGRFYRSDNQGTTWYRLRPPYNGSFFGTLPLQSDSLLIFGMRGNVFRSDDKGVSYSPVDVGVNALLTGGFQAASGKLVVVGLAGVVLESRDGGVNFSVHRQADRSGNMMVLPAADEGVVLIGESGVQRLTEAGYRAGGKR